MPMTLSQLLLVVRSYVFLKLFILIMVYHTSHGPDIATCAVTAFDPASD